MIRHARKLRHSLLGALGVLLIASVPAPGAATAAPKPDLWPRWEQHNAQNRLHIDHGAWSEFLQRNLIAKHPSGISRINYGRVSKVDRLILDGYIDLLQETPISTFNRDEQKAYWQQQIERHKELLATMEEPA